MARYRLYPTPEQEALLLEHCAHARYVWNLAVEQRSWWQPGRPAPGYVEQARQFTEARAAFSWLAEAPQMIQQQALRDFHRRLVGLALLPAGVAPAQRLSSAGGADATAGPAIVA
jgi:putative transposase